MPRISVVMSVYNGEKYLSEAIKSILNQIYKDFEFIIIDDGSTDSSRAIITSFKDDRIKPLINERNIGLTKSLNKGLFYADGEFIARQDADDISLPERLELQIQCLDRHPEVAVLGTSYYVIDKDGKIIEERKPAPNPMSTLITGNRLTHGSVMFRHSVMEELGKYDECHFKYAQDYEYWLRISKHYQIKNLEQSLYKLRVHSNTIGIEKCKEQAMCVLLAQRMGKSSDNSPILQYENLTKQERARFHTLIAYNFMQIGDTKTARHKLLKAIRAQPDKENIGNLFLCYLGKERALAGQNIYRNMRFKMQKHLRLSI